MRRVLVTGAGRGLGLSICEALGMRDGVEVIPAYRRREPKAAGSGLLIDYSDSASIDDATTELARNYGSIDVLINCGAINKVVIGGVERTKGPIGELRHEPLSWLLMVDAVGPLYLISSLWPLLQRSKCPLVVNITSARGSLAMADAPNAIGYSMGKAALNMATRKVAAAMPPPGACIGFDPGWIRTDMGGPDAPSDAAQVSGTIADLISSAELRQLNGLVVDASGRRMDW